MVVRILQSYGIIVMILQIIGIDAGKLEGFGKVWKSKAALNCQFACLLDYLLIVAITTWQNPGGTGY